MKPAYLVLADGTVFEGRSIGADGVATGEIVFHTGLSGYQEIITDPSYCGQIVTFTCPHIGNVGVNSADMESTMPHVRGLVMRDYCPTPSNWRSTQPLHRYLKQHQIVAIEGVDTRTITRRIRTQGAMPGIIATQANNLDALIAHAASLEDMTGKELVSEVTASQPYEWTQSLWDMPAATDVAGAPLVIVYDFGVKQNILRCLVAQGVRVEVVPATTPAATVLAKKPAGVLLSNGPGDPAAVDFAVTTIKELMGQVPLFGICLGHQLLGRALGATTFKLPFGHHGANQPVRDEHTGVVEITSQNHGFAVDPETLPSEIEITHVNLNDGTIEGFRSTRYPLMAIQYHPEASPGPHDSFGCFQQFIGMCRAKTN